MGTQSARMYFDGNDHRDIFFQGKFHDKMYVGNQLVWEKLRFKYFAVLSYLGSCIVDLATKSIECIYNAAHHNPNTICNGRTMISTEEFSGKSSIIVSCNGTTWKKAEMIPETLFDVGPMCYDYDNNYALRGSSGTFYIYHVWEDASYVDLVDRFELSINYLHTENVATDGSVLLLGINYTNKQVFYYADGVQEFSFTVQNVRGAIAKEGKIYLLVEEYTDGYILVYDTKEKTSEYIRSNTNFDQIFRIVYSYPDFYLYAHNDFIGYKLYITDDGINYLLGRIPGKMEINDISNNIKRTIGIGDIIDCVQVSSSYFWDETCQGNIGHMAGVMLIKEENRDRYFVYINNLFFRESDNNFMIKIDEDSFGWG